MNLDIKTIYIKEQPVLMLQGNEVSQDPLVMVRDFGLYLDQFFHVVRKGHAKVPKVLFLCI
jgi:hypothetical protein